MRQTIHFRPRTRRAHSIFDFFQRDRILILLQLTILLVVVVDFAIHTTHFTQNLGLFTFTSIVAMGLIIMPRLARKAGLGSFLVHSMFHVMIGVFLVFIAPLGSAYELIAVLVMYTASYWYGLRGFLTSFIFFVIIFQAAYLYQSETGAFSGLFSQLNLKLLVLGLIGALIDRLHALDLQDRQQLIKMGEVVNYEQQRLRSLINSMGDAVIATDARGHILVYNGVALELLNTNESIDGKKLEHYFHTFTTKKHPIDLIALARKEGTLLKRDDILLQITKDEFINLYVSIAKIHLNYSEKGEEGYILLMRDITREKSIEEQRDEFISVVSHELRTPIAIAEANISTAMLPAMLKDPARVRDLLDQAHQNVLFLGNLVNDITTLAHAERGDLKATVEDVDPSQLLEEIAETFRSQAANKKLKLKVIKDRTVPIIRSNSYRLNEILHNFITNAIKYSDTGTITISVTRPDNAHVEFSVKDMGIGLSKSDQKHVFEKFWRSEDYRIRSHSGTGLGLYISKKLAERMRGVVSVESQLNKGSTFSLTVPLSIEN